MNSTISNQKPCCEPDFVKDTNETRWNLIYQGLTKNPAGYIWKQFGAPVVMYLAIVLGLFLFSDGQALTSIHFSLDALARISPYILVSVGVAAMLKASEADKLVAKAFLGNPVKSIAVASVFGALSPFCSCGVIPLVAGLLAAGVPIAPVLAFCIASPIMDPEMFILTFAGLGLEFAVVKTIAALGMGMTTGYIMLLITKSGYLDDSLKSIAKPSCSAGDVDTNASVDDIKWAFWRFPDRLTKFWSEMKSSSWFLGRWLLFAFILESLMVAYLPGHLVAEWLGSGNLFAIPLATVVGIPAYLNGYSAIPLIRGLVDLGMSPGTGLAFMIAGSVTSIPAAIAVWTLAKPRLFGLYILMATIGATVSGFVYTAWL